MTNQMLEKPQELDRVARGLSRSWSNQGAEMVGTAFGYAGSGDSKEPRWLLYVYSSAENYDALSRSLPRAVDGFDVVVKITPRCLFS